MKNIGIIVLNWQGWKDTILCLDSLWSLQCPIPFSLIVCDNASTNDSVAQILHWAQCHYSLAEIKLISPPFIETSEVPFTLIQTGHNLGFAGGVNVGIRYALAARFCEYLWVLNNDTRVDAQALTALYHCAQQNSQVALLGSTILDYEDTDKVQCAGGCRYYPLLTIIKPWGRGKSLKEVLNYPAHALKLDYIYGASLFLRISAIQKVGLLNEDYFLFYEELDYAHRLTHQGYQMAWCRNSLVYHKGSASIQRTSDNPRTSLQQANYYENLNTLKYTANFYPNWLIWVMLIRFTLKSLVLLLRWDMDLFSPLYKAYQDFIQHKRRNVT